MKCDAAFRDRIRLECYDAFERHGFVRFRKQGVDYPLGDGFHCWVGLNTGLYPDRVDLVPNIGLHVVPIEKMICDLETGQYARKYDRRVATYATNIGTLKDAGEERAFAFSPVQSDSFIESECSRLASLYKQVCIPYVRSIAKYEILAGLLKKNVYSMGGIPERYASCLYMIGKKKEAKEFLASFPERHKDGIQGFSRPFIVLVDAELRGHP